MVLECDIYGDEDLWSKFFKKSGKTQLYFFIKTKKKTEGGSKIKRTAGYGTWKAQRDQPIYRDDNKKYHISSLRAFSFFPKNPTMANAGSCMNIDSMDVSYPIHNMYFIHSYVIALIFNFIKDWIFIYCLILYITSFLVNFSIVFL